MFMLLIFDFFLLVGEVELKYITFPYMSKSIKIQKLKKIYKGYENSSLFSRQEIKPA